MKKLLILLLVSTGLFAQNPTTDRQDAEFRKHGGKGLSKNDYTDADKAKVQTIPPTIVQSVNGRSGAVTLGKPDVNLSNVPNIDATNPLNILWTSLNRTVTDADKSRWNKKADSAAIYQKYEALKGAGPYPLSDINSLYQADFDNAALFTAWLGGKLDTTAWNAFKSTVASRVVNNYFSNLNTFSGNFDAASTPGFDISNVEISPWFQPKLGSDPVRFFALRLLPNMYPPQGGLPSSSKMYALQAQGDISLGGNIELEANSQYSIGSTSKRLQTLYSALVDGSVGKFPTLYTPLVYSNGAGIAFKSNADAGLATLYENGNLQIGTPSTSNGYKLEVKGGVSASSSSSLAGFTSSAASTISSSSGSPLSLTMNYSAGGGTFGLHVFGTATGQSGGAKFSNTVAGGVSNIAFYNNGGGSPNFQFWNGSTTDTYAPDALGFQWVRGNADMAVYAAGAKFRWGATLPLTDAAAMVYNPATKNLAVGSVTTALTFQSGAAAPTASNIAAGQAILWKNTTDGTTKWYINDGGTIKSGAAFN